MAIRIIVDSGSDILPGECRELGLRHLPLKVVFGREEFSDGVDMSHREFYERLIESDALPTTCQVPPGEFERVYEQLREEGDEGIVIALSSKLSGTCQSARIAGEEHPQITVVDSESVSLGQRILALRALELVKAGLDRRETVRRLEAEKKQIRVMALLDTLEYLKKGGRISSAVALAGSLLSIKPVVALEEGAVAMAGKARGSRQGNNLLRLLVEKSGGIDFDRPLCLAYSGLSDALLRKYMEDSGELWQGKADGLTVATIGCAIGTHVGPGAIAVAFFEKGGQ